MEKQPLANEMESRAGARPIDIDQGNYVQSLSRGLSVILAFADHRSQLTLSEVAAATQLARPTARRLLLTLEALGYVQTVGRNFSLTPRVLALGYAYLNSLDLTAIAEPLMERLVSEVHETCTLVTLDIPDIVYVSRISTRRISSLSLVIGTRIPANASAMGQVLLADLTPDELRHYLDVSDLPAITPQTLRTEQDLVKRLTETRARGWGESDQEIERGLRAVATPVRGGDGRVFASLGISSTTATLEELREHHLPLLKETAAEIGSRLGSDNSASPDSLSGPPPR